MTKRKKLFFNIGIIFGFLMVFSVGWTKEGNKIPFHLQQSHLGQNLTNDELCIQVEMALFIQTNEQRLKKRLNKLNKGEVLREVAQDYSGEMMEKGFMSHFNPEGKNVVDRVKLKLRTKEVKTSLGENLHMIHSAKGLKDPKAIADVMMKDWMNSPSHRANILSNKFYQQGIGCRANGTDIYCTQIFSGKNL